MHLVARRGRCATVSLPASQVTSSFRPKSTHVSSCPRLESTPFRLLSQGSRLLPSVVVTLLRSTEPSFAPWPAHLQRSCLDRPRPCLGARLARFSFLCRTSPQRRLPPHFHPSENETPLTPSPLRQVIRLSDPHRSTVLSPVLANRRLIAPPSQPSPRSLALRPPILFRASGQVFSYLTPSSPRVHAAQPASASPSTRTTPPSFSAPPPDAALHRRRC